ncbi:hypothetical protein [Amorphus orientalis]|uniref:Lipoprotein n=1 Tax=Amorphus orientalis TaxID=649198 RepID=A0AAE4ASD8_9HYPH|nr:hypothetical protein [Amorphus orientalis]MDQ0316151.1 hypothetical protein [Amorphus orientalis]
MRPVRRLVRAAALSVPALALSLAGCSSISSVTDAVTPDADSTFGSFLRGTTAEPTTIDVEQFRRQQACPSIEILPDTNTLRVTTGGNAFEEGVVRYQATIARTARECTEAAGGATGIKVGLAGRAISGPEGAAGTLKLPLRIAVREGDSVTYSKLHVVTVDLTDAKPSDDWVLVDPGITVSDPDNAKILVGFDNKRS